MISAISCTKKSVGSNRTTKTIPLPQSSIRWIGLRFNTFIRVDQSGFGVGFSQPETCCGRTKVPRSFQTTMELRPRPGATRSHDWGAWGGFGGFLTAYGETAVAGPITHILENTERVRPLGAEAVADLGNWAVSFGQEEMWWGTGHLSSIAQSNNADPIPGFRLQKFTQPYCRGPSAISGSFECRFSSADSMRAGSPRWQAATSPVETFARPWIDGQILSFKTLPNFEWGITHAIMFGGVGNSNYSLAGFFGRATALNTGNPAGGNTHSEGGRLP